MYLGPFLVCVDRGETSVRSSFDGRSRHHTDAPRADGRRSQGGGTSEVHLRAQHEAQQQGAGVWTPPCDMQQQRGGVWTPPRHEAPSLGGGACPQMYPPPWERHPPGLLQSTQRRSTDHTTRTSASIRFHKHQVSARHRPGLYPPAANQLQLVCSW